MKGVILSRTHPDYPIEARRARITGGGVFEMRIDPKSGRVKGSERARGHVHYESVEALAPLEKRKWLARLSVPN
jgi:hypothetical protein